MQKFIQRRQQIYLYAAFATMIGTVFTILTYFQTPIIPTTPPSNTTYVYLPVVQTAQQQVAPAPQESSREVATAFHDASAEGPPVQDIEAPPASQADTAVRSPRPEQRPRVQVRPQNPPAQRFAALPERSSPEESREPAGLVFRHVAR